MNKGLMLKQWYAFRKIARPIGGMIVVFGAVAIFSGNSGMALYVNTLVMVAALMVCLNTIAEDEKSNWDIYGLTLPITRKESIRAHYLTVLIYMVAGSSFMILLHAVLYAIHGLDMVEGIVSTASVLAVVVLAQSLLIPLVIKKGSAKARIYIMVIMGVPFVVFVVAMQLLEVSGVGALMPSEEVLERMLEIGKFALPVILLVILYISYCASVSIFNKKEF